MRLLLDSSVLLAACGSDKGGSREVFRRAGANGWVLLSTPYIVEEVVTNLPYVSQHAIGVWPNLERQLSLMDDVLTLDQVSIFESAKDRPILFSALAWAEVLLTLDREDFGKLLGGTFYGLAILTPGMFLEAERARSPNSV